MTELLKQEAEKINQWISTSCPRAATIYENYHVVNNDSTTVK